jgi:hypothetical protein
MDEIRNKINKIERLIFKLNAKKEKLIKGLWSNIICSLQQKRDEGWILFIFRSCNKNREEDDIIRFYLIEPNLYYKFINKFHYANFWHMSIGGQKDIIERSEDYIRFENTFFGSSKFFCGINYDVLEPYELREVFPEIFEKFF